MGNSVIIVIICSDENNKLRNGLFAAEGTTNFSP